MHLCGIHQVSRGGISLNIGPDLNHLPSLGRVCCYTLIFVGLGNSWAILKTGFAQKIGIHAFVFGVFPIWAIWAFFFLYRPTPLHRVPAQGGVHTLYAQNQNITLINFFFAQIAQTQKIGLYGIIWGVFIGQFA